jgi:hypothetical protein
MKHIFGDFKIQYLHYDAEACGVLLKAKKPTAWQPRELNYELYSMAIGKRSLFPVPISFTRKTLVLLQLFLQKAVRQKPLQPKSNGKTPSSTVKTPYSKKVRILLQRSRLIM